MPLAPAVEQVGSGATPVSRNPACVLVVPILELNPS
jgi:hypothetical protein